MFTGFFISALRAVKFSLQDIARNFWLSIVTITILVLALFSINILLSVKIISKSAIDSVREKIDINLYLKTDAPEDEIMALRAQLSNLGLVKEVTYISKTDALEAFKEQHRNNPEVLMALRELNSNPLTPTLVIKPKNVEQYEELINSLNRLQSDIIESKNFSNPKEMLNKINSIAEKVNQAGIFVSLIFVVITILVVYNSIRVAIYTHQREIRIMRLVGASHWFIRAPYLISSFVYTIIGLTLAILLFYPFLSLLQPYLEVFFSGYNFNIVTYFNQNFNKIFGLEFLVASLINIVASFVAVRKYSKV